MRRTPTNSGLRAIRALAVVLAVGGLGGLAGCFFGDLDGLAGPPLSDDGAVADVAAADSAVDGTGPPTPDGGSDASVDAAFCATHTGHFDCADFDNAMLPSDWKVHRDDGSLAWSSAQSLSAPGALLSTLPRRATNLAYSVLQKSVTNSFHRTVLELDVYAEQPDFQNGDSNAGVLSIAFFSSTTNEEISLALGAAYMTVGTPGASVQINHALAYGTWVHMKFDLDPAGKLTGNVGADAIAQTFTALVPGNSPQTVVSLGIDGYNVPAPQYVIYYDNVLIDAP